MISRCRHERPTRAWIDFFYCTTRVKAFVCGDRLPLVAVTVTVYVPAAVAPVFVVLPLLLFPPPQPAPAAKNTSSISPSPPRRRRRQSGTPRKKMPENNAPSLAASQPEPLLDPGQFNAPDVPAVVWTVKVEAPEPLATGFALNVHDGAGLPPPVTAQARFTDPAKPPLGVIVMVEVADVPAATDAGFSAGAAIAKPGDATVKLTDVLWTVDPEVPVTVKFEVPSGVFEFVLMVRVDVPDVVSDPCTKAQVAPTGRPEQVRLTVPLNPFSIETVMVDVPDCPGAGTVTGLPPIEKSGALAKVGHEVTRTSALIDPRPVTRS